MIKFWLTWSELHFGSHDQYHRKSFPSKLYLADVAAAVFITVLTCATLLPFSIYTGKILLQARNNFRLFFNHNFLPVCTQTAPEHTLPVLDKYLHEISIMDGVLEIKNEHFWTISFGSLVRKQGNNMAEPYDLDLMWPLLFVLGHS